MKNPGRKLYHCLGGLLLLSAWHLLGPARATALYAVLFSGILLFDLVRLRAPAFNSWAMRSLGSLVRPSEEKTISGSPTYVAGVAATLLVFPTPVATAAVLFLVFGDVFASIVGEAWGRTKFRGKSLEGTAAFLAAAFLAGLAARTLVPGVTLAALAAGAATAAAAEAFTDRPLNDNLTIPLFSGAVMTLMALAGAGQ